MNTLIFFFQVVSIVTREKILKEKLGVTLFQDTKFTEITIGFSPLGTSFWYCGRKLLAGYKDPCINIFAQTF